MNPLPSHPDAERPAHPLTQRRVLRRRVVLFSLTGASTIWATCKWAAYMPTHLDSLTHWLLVALFFLTFAWISLFFWAGILGFISLTRSRVYEDVVRPPESAELRTRTAIIMPVYNENPTAVYARLAAMAGEIAATGQGRAFDVFVLSDSTDPAVWLHEEWLWLRAKEMFPEGVGLHYRHRPRNVAKKSGNIEDFCAKWGSRYDFMLVLDADSLMRGSTILRLSQLMEANPRVGIIQVPPLLVNSRTLFARINQFASRVYGTIIAAGLAYWQAWDSNYWGHNAIIRTRAFMESCGLPTFEGKAPFGGFILSHDFVEAALIRRAGWLTWMLPDLGGSYEECPPTLLDFAQRDRRWCQGNIQHLRILFSRNIHPVSRLHFALGIMSYVSSPLWCLFLTIGIGAAIWRSLFPPAYFPVSKTLFPTWPVFDMVGTVLLFVLALAMLFAPKILGVLLIARQGGVGDRAWKRGLWPSFLLESAFSVLTAPIMMLFHSIFVVQVLLGLDSGWRTQNRAADTSWKTAARRHFWHTLAGVAVTIGVHGYAENLFWWVLPITTGLMLSIPLSVFSSRESWGREAARRGLLLTPEELSPPPLLAAAARAETDLDAPAPEAFGVETLVRDPAFLAAHCYLMSVNGPSPGFDARIAGKTAHKLKKWCEGGGLSLDTDEMRYCMYHPALLQKISLLAP